MIVCCTYLLGDVAKAPVPHASTDVAVTWLWVAVSVEVPRRREPWSQVDREGSHGQPEAVPVSYTHCGQCRASNAVHVLLIFRKASAAKARNSIKSDAVLRQVIRQVL
jgi:hypothetical protein